MVLFLKVGCKELFFATISPWFLQNIFLVSQEDRKGSGEGRRGGGERGEGGVGEKLLSLISWSVFE